MKYQKRRYCPICKVEIIPGHKYKRNGSDANNTEQPIQDIVYEADGWQLVDNPINVKQPRG